MADPLHVNAETAYLTTKNPAGRYTQTPAHSQEHGSIYGTPEPSGGGGFLRWLNPQPLGFSVEPGVNPQHSRSYSFGDQDFNEILLDIQNAGPDWNKSIVGQKILTDLTNDPATRPTLEQFPSKVLNPIYGEGAKPAPMLPMGTQSWKNMVTTDEIDRLNSRMMGGGYFGNLAKTASRLEDLWTQDESDIQHWNQGKRGYYQDILKDLDLELSPFNIMYADELNELYRTDDQTITPQIDPILDLSGIDSGDYDHLATVNDRSIASIEPMEDILRNNPGILRTSEPTNEPTWFPASTSSGVISGEDPAPTDWRTILGIDPAPDYTWQEVLGIGQPGPGGPVRPAYNRDEFGNVASLSRFTEPEVDTDDFIINNLIDSMSRVGQPGPGGPVRPQPEQDDSSNARQAREADERARANREKERERAVTPPKTKTKTKAKTKLVPRVSAEEIFEARHKDLMDALNEGYSRAGRAVLPPSHMLYDI